VTDTLGVILSGARLRHGWTLRDAERETGIANAHISQMETGKITAPGIVHLVKLARAYGLPLRRLLEAAGQGGDWALVAEASEAEIRAGERERIALLAEEHEARYDVTKPCGCGRISPRTGRPCTVVLKGGLPFADLIRKGLPDLERPSD
jgi:transcriptional regulator with XRE-family HTH domain